MAWLLRKKGEVMERQQSSKEKSLAWFKLADLIARGEREKALNVFRLLAHSLQDRAYVLQVEGDILWYLDDKNSTEKYKQAAFLYQKEKRWVNAIAVYEHLFTQDPESYEVISTLLLLYAMIDWTDKFKERYTHFCALFHNNVFDESKFEKTLQNIIDLARNADDPNSKAWIAHWLGQALSEVPCAVAEQLKGQL